MPTAVGWRRASGCRRTPRTIRCRRILEYLPYRKRDGTAARDALTPSLFRRPWLRLRSASTCAAAATPMAFCYDEYLPQEQDDALEVIAWLAAQPWCSGSGRHDRHLLGRLQRAAGRGAPAAGAQGDHHALLDRRPLRRRHPLHGRLPPDRQLARWALDDARASTRARPIPQLVGEQLARNLARPSGADAAFWSTPGSRISAATTSGGMARSARTMARSTARSTPSAAGRTATRNAVPRLLAGLPVPRKGLIGPWAHHYPHVGDARPADRLPAGGLRWWDHWLKGIDDRHHGRADVPRLDAGEAPPPAPTRAGRALGRRAAWPAPAITTRSYALNADALKNCRRRRAKDDGQWIRTPFVKPSAVPRPTASTPAPGAPMASLATSRRPARRGWARAVLHIRAARCAARDPGLP